MIHYHGTPIGGKRGDVPRFLSGRHALVPWIRPEDLECVAECCQSFCLDNSAFSIWRSQGDSPKWSEYYEWVSEWMRHPGFDFALIPDVIDGTAEENDAMIDQWPHGKSRGVPVWHLHEPLDRLAWLCDEWPRVALGSSGEWRTPNTKAWWRRMSQAMNAATTESGQAKAKLHGLRMLNPDVYRHLPLSSADSTNAAQNANLLSRFGTYKPPQSWQGAEMIAHRIEAYQSSAAWIDMSHWKQASLFEMGESV